MALVRCQNCGCPKGRKGNIYSSVAHLPVNHPDSGVVCGTSACINPGIVWLLDSEENEYQHGRREFQLTGGQAGVKLRVQ